MEEPEERTHSFVLKFWLEEVEETTGQGVWRGYITHVATGARQYVKTLDNIPAFVAPYLEEDGAQWGKRNRLRRWLRAKFISSSGKKKGILAVAVQHSTSPRE